MITMRYRFYNIYLHLTCPPIDPKNPQSLTFPCQLRNVTIASITCFQNHHSLDILLFHHHTYEPCFNRCTTHSYLYT